MDGDDVASGYVLQIHKPPHSLTFLMKKYPR
jgi:hypothetical protein